MSLGNLKHDPKDPTKVIKVGICGTDVPDKDKNRLFYGVMFAVLLGSFGKNACDTFKTSTPIENAMTPVSEKPNLPANCCYVPSDLIPR